MGLADDQDNGCLLLWHQDSRSSTWFFAVVGRWWCEPPLVVLGLLGADKETVSLAGNRRQRLRREEQCHVQLNTYERETEKVECVSVCICVYVSVCLPVYV